MRDKPKPKPTFTIKNKSKACALLYQHLKFEEDAIAEDDTTSEKYAEQDTSILVHSEVAKTLIQVTSTTSCIPSIKR